MSGLLSEDEMDDPRIEHLSRYWFHPETLLAGIDRADADAGIVRVRKQRLLDLQYERDRLAAEVNRYRAAAAAAAAGDDE